MFRVLLQFYWVKPRDTRKTVEVIAKTGQGPMHQLWAGQIHQLSFFCVLSARFLNFLLRFPSRGIHRTCSTSLVCQVGVDFATKPVKGDDGEDGALNRTLPRERRNQTCTDHSCVGGPGISVPVVNYRWRRTHLDIIRTRRSPPETSK